MAGDYYVELDVATDEGSAVDAFIDRLQDEWPGWMPNDGDPEVRTAEAIAPLAVDALTQASRVPPEALIQFGVKLLGIPFNDGAPAYGEVKVTMQDDAGGYRVDAGSQIEIDGFAFRFVSDIQTSYGQTQINGVVASIDLTSAANELMGASVRRISMPAWVTDLELLSPTSAGEDPQSAADYLDEISRDRKMTSRAIVTLEDMELVALDLPGVARAHAEWTSARTATVWMVADDGGIVPGPVKAQLSNPNYPATSSSYGLLQDPNARMVNVTTVVADPTYNTIDITYQVRPVPGQDGNDLIMRINAAIAAELSPLGYGGATPADWYNDATIRINRIIVLVGASNGAKDVGAVTINGVAANFVMSGPVALPEAGSIIGTLLS